MPAPVTRKMSSRHEDHLAEVLQGTKTRNSGATWADQGDGHQTHSEGHWRFTWDGKALGLDAQILTPQGYTKMGDIQVGDQVLDAHSGVTEVTGVHPQGVMDMYQVNFSDGTSVEATDDHLWGLNQRTCGKVNGRQKAVVRERVWTTQQLADLNQEGLRRCWLPASGVAQFSGSLPSSAVSPYILGALLGDGKIGSGSCVLTSADEEIVTRVTQELHPGYLVTKFADRGTCAAYRIKGRGPGGKTFRDVLADSGVSMVNSHLKAIPDPYMWSCEDDRLALLQGLLDTDGWAEKGSARFVSTSVILRDQVAWIARSLGLRVNTYQRATPTYRGRSGERLLGKEAYQATIGYHPNLFHLERKRELLRPPQRTFRRTFWSIEKVEPKEAQCITVLAQDGLFLVEDFVPTHNSTLGKSIGVTVEMWQKITEQSRGLLPMIPLRWYGDNRLTKIHLDLVAIDLDTFAEMQNDANAYHRIINTGCAGGLHDFSSSNEAPGMVIKNGPCTACGLSPYEAGYPNESD